MNKHTPGPWKVFVSGKVIEVHAAEKPPIVPWIGFDDSDRSLTEHKANARLIAMAPEMLETLEETAQMYHMIGNAIAHGNQTFEECAATMCTRARQIIAKAKGQTS